LVFIDVYIFHSNMMSGLGSMIKLGMVMTWRQMLEQSVRRTAVLRGSHPLLTSALKS